MSKKVENRNRNKAPLRGYFFVSRNKDNKNIEGFKERKVTFVSSLPSEEIHKRFELFVSAGLPGEFCRLYCSINARKEGQSQKALLHYLIDNDINLGAIESITASVAMKKENAATKYWLFDFDSNSEVLLKMFMGALRDAYENNPSNKGDKFYVETTPSAHFITDSKYDIVAETRPTPNGYAVITYRGFKCDELLNEWKTDKNGEDLVTLKRDGMLCVDWKSNGEAN